ncbi:hypothetical protein [Nostoc sp. 2RC]|uniref:hypothetical protein n=1 Tax=Nostoc sp. 2RC TaxID=2485484 RepID=UPI0016245B52|nr:hypothetical protein [Nostoc sp. 2RC]MBC1240761.1 hypothetical protein [Nostoc sp. 2RC]
MHYVVHGNVANTDYVIHWQFSAFVNYLNDMKKQGNQRSIAAIFETAIAITDG